MFHPLLIRARRWALLAGTLAVLASGLEANESPFPFVNALSPSSNSLMYEWRATPGDDTSLYDNRLRAAFVVHKSTTDLWAVQQSVSRLDITKQLVISETGLVIPEPLWDIEAGGSFRRKLAGDRTFGVAGSIGSASDDPFQSFHETTLRLTGSYRIPSKKENAWIFLLSYSNNRHFANNIPLPGVVYLLHTNYGWDILLGFPLVAVNYKPAPRWNHRMSAFGPGNLSAESSFKVAGPVETYAGFDWNERGWLRAGRNDNRNRLFLEQKRWSFGLRVPVSQSTRLELGSGYEYNRRFYEDRTTTDDSTPRANLESAWTFLFRGSVRW